MLTELRESTRETVQVSGRWVTEVEYATIQRLARQTLTNWRHRDRKAGRNEAAPGYPRYRRYGAAIRYWLDDEAGGGRVA